MGVFFSFLFSLKELHFRSVFFAEKQADFLREVQNGGRPSGHVLFPHIFRPIGTYHSHKKGIGRRKKVSLFFSGKDASHSSSSSFFGSSKSLSFSRKERKKIKAHVRSRQKFSSVLTPLRSLIECASGKTKGGEIDFPLLLPLGEHGNDLCDVFRRVVV